MSTDTQHRDLILLAASSTLLALAASSTLLALLFVACVRATWLSDPAFHTVVEACATVLAGAVGVLALARHYAKRSGMYLLLGAGFLGTAVLDGYHTIVTSPWLSDQLPSELPSLIPWSWISSRLFLSGVFVLSYVAWKWERRNTNRHVNETAVFASIGFLALTSGLLFAAFDLPSGYFPGALVHRPAELVPATLFGVALAAHYRRHKVTGGAVDRWLLLSLLVGLVGQAVFMPLSVQLFDAMFDAAHGLKIVSYALVFGGLSASTAATYRQIQSAAEEVQRAYLRAEQADRAKGRFLATVSHEIRTPLNAIIGLSNLAAGVGPGAEQQALLRSIQASSESLSFLISDLLDLSHMEAGGMEMDFSPFELCDVVEKPVELMSPAAEAKGLELTCRIERGLPTRLLGDADRTRQVLLNLISNAIKYTDTGRVSVIVRDKGRSGGNHKVRFEVRDTGMGIADADQRRIFERFVRTSSASSVAVGGAGLGLHISRSLVELMGGTIHVGSEPGVGSSFAFEVPYGIAGEPSEFSGPSRTELGGFAALVAVQDDEHRRATRDLLVELGFGTVQELALLDGAAARRCVGDSRVRVVVVDEQVPGLAEFEAARQTASDQARRRVPTVVLATFEGMDRARRLEYAVVLHKPARQQQFRDAVLQAVGLMDAATPASSEASPWLTQSRIKNVVAGSERSVVCEPRRILLVEDDPANRIVTLRTLAKSGYEVDIAEDGFQALERTSNHTYDLILMDLQMPGMTGFVVTERIRELAAKAGRARVPIVALTARTVPGTRRRCLEAGMDECLIKPVLPAALLALIERMSVTRPVRLSEFGPPVGEDCEPFPTTDVDPDIAELVPAYVANRRRDVLEIYRLLEKSSFDEIGKLGHQMKGSGAGFGFAQIGRLGAEIDEAARGGDRDRLSDLVQQLEACLATGAGGRSHPSDS